MYFVSEKDGIKYEQNDNIRFWIYFVLKRYALVNGKFHYKMQTILCFI